MISPKRLSSGNKGMYALISFALLMVAIAPASANMTAKIRSTTDAARWGSETAVSVIPKTTTTNHVDLDTTAKLQVIDGFGGAFNEMGWNVLQHLSASSADSVIRSLFDTTNGCKFNICRMPIGASDYCLAKVYPLDPTSTDHTPDWYSLNENSGDTLMTKISVARDSAYLLQYIKAAMKYRPLLKIWGSPWSPPAWMKTTHTYNQGNLTWNSQICNAYALYLEKAVQLYQKQGINFYALSFQNESTQWPNYPGCEWSQTQHRDFIKLYLGPRFANDNINCEIWTPTMNCSDITYFTTMLSDALTASFVKKVCFQWAGKSVLDQVNQQYPGKFKIYQTEQECGSGETGAALWDYAVTSVWYNMKYYFDRMASAYMQWNMVLAPGGVSAWGWTQNAMITVDTTAKKVTYNPQYYVAKHFSYYVKPNARKVTSTGNFADQVAFQNPDDGSIVVVLSNSSTSSMPVSITFGSNMINVTLPGNSFTTAVVYPGTAVRDNHSVHAGEAAMMVKTTMAGNFIVFTPPSGSSYELQLMGIDGRSKASFSSKSKGICAIKKDAISPGMYVLKGVINGRQYSEAVPVVNR